METGECFAVLDKKYMMKATRLLKNPILVAGQHPDIGSNINGPSLIRVPRLGGKPRLAGIISIFSHHKGTFTRLAYADRLEGPWAVHPGGALHIEQTSCENHIASPDVHIDPVRREIRMYYHGVVSKVGEEYLQARRRFPILGNQFSFVAVSKDGLNFTSRSEILGVPYFRVFAYGGMTYALGMPGIFYRSVDGLGGFEQGPILFTKDMRHSALLLKDKTLTVFYSNAGDTPERILAADIDLAPDWVAWKQGAARTILEPEKKYEGADLVLRPSLRGWAPTRVRQLRDPGIFQEDGKTYLLYSVAGEHGIALAELEE